MTWRDQMCRLLTGQCFIATVRFCASERASLRLLRVATIVNNKINAESKQQKSIFKQNDVIQQSTWIHFH